MLASLFDQRCEVFPGRPVGKPALGKLFRQHSQDTALWETLGTDERIHLRLHAACLLSQNIYSTVGKQTAQVFKVKCIFKAWFMCIVSPQDTCRYLSLGWSKYFNTHAWFWKSVLERLDPWSVVVITFTIIAVPSSPAHRLGSALLKSPQGALERAGQASGGTI